MIGWLALAAQAAPTAWWVPDEALAPPLQAALDEAWPGAEVEIRVGPLPPSGPPARAWDGAALIVWDGARARRAPADDADVAVLLARTWALPAASEPTAYAFLPAPPPPPPAPPPPPLPILDDPPPSGPAWSLGLGTRTLSDQPRWVDALRVVGTLGDGPVALQAAVLAAPEPGRGLTVSDDPGSEATTPWTDRLGLGVSAAITPVGIGPVSLRAVAGPEVRWTEHWLYYQGQRSSNGFFRAAAVGGAGLAVTLGRVELAATGLVRLSTGQGPPVDGGVDVDLRYRRHSTSEPAEQ
ncbi:MAG: hypothetical protein R3F59_04205 [Myxococcota bacterium]